MSEPRLLHIIKGTPIFQEEDNRIHYVSDLDDDCDGSPHSYRLDNDSEKAMDDIHASAGYPHGDWWNVLVRDPLHPEKPYVDKNGYCVSMTSYQRKGFNELDRYRYLDATKVAYAVCPGILRKLCKGILLGCLARVTDTTSGKSIQCVTGDFSGYSLGEASDYVCKSFNPLFSPKNGDSHTKYLYEFWPGTVAKINGETFDLIPA